MKALIGPANSGKTERIISRVAEAMIEARGQVRFLVPSSQAASIINERLQAKLAGKTFRSLQQTITTFPGIYEAILKSSGRSLTRLNFVERARLLRRVIYGLEEKGELVYFADAVSMPGLVNAVAGFIDELWQTAMSPADFNRVAQSRGKKEKDLALIYKTYSDNLDSFEKIDSEAAGYAALHALASRPASLSLGFSLVAADGFDFYSPVQTRLLKLLSSRGVETIASLTYEEDRAVHLWQKPTIERLGKQGAQFIHCAANPSTVIEIAYANFMSDDSTGNANERDRTGAIQIISAPDRASEIKAVAREIKKLVIRNAFAANDIAIVCRSLSLYAHHIERIFEDCSIPFVLDCSLSVAENPGILSILKLLGLSSASFPRRVTLECLRSPYFDFSSLGLNEDAADLLDIISLEETVMRGREQWLNAIETFAGRAKRERRDVRLSEDDEPIPETVASRCEALLSNLASFFAEMTPPVLARAADFVQWVIAAVEKFGAKQPEEPARASSRDKKALAEFYSIVNALGLDSPIAGLSNNHSGEVRWNDFQSELESALSVVTYEREIPPQGGVAVQDAHKIWPRPYGALFIIGLVEGEFPARTAERAPFTNQEREELRESGIDLTETAADAGGDLAQFSKAISRAKQRLYLSYSRIDLAGGELLPSYLIEEIRAVAPVREMRIQQGLAGVEQSMIREIASLEELAVSTARAIAALSSEGKFSLDSLGEDVKAASSLLDSQLPSWKNTLRAASVETRRLGGGERGRYDGIIQDPELLNHLNHLFGPARMWSASQINDYGVCPFRFFAKQALKLARIEEPAEGFRSDKLGIAYHEILEALYKRLRLRRISVLPATSKEAIAEVDKISEEVLQNMLNDGSIRKGVFWDFDKREIKRRISRLLVKEADWNAEQFAKPEHLECKFGIDDEKPLVIESEEGQIMLRGQIDRIDLRDDGLVVIDYKLGRAPIHLRDALDGRNLQLPIYAMAATRVIDTAQRVASAYYLHIGSRKKGSELSRDESEHSIESLIEQAEKRILDYVAKARKGVFPVKPNGDRCHPKCEFETMCRIQSLGQSISDE